ncbi:MAG: selenide, water dikinase SelD [Alphaproteobacteria bacterium]
MQPSVPLTRDLVLVGGGHAHALVLRRWGMKPLPGVRLTLINPGPSAPYTGMLPGHLAGHYSREELDIDLMRLARFAGARLVLGRANGLDRAARRIRMTGRPDVAYDVVSLDVGITSDMPALPGFSAHGVSAKPLEGLADGWSRFLERVGRGEADARIAVIGGGVAGVEIAMALAFRLHKERVSGAAITVLEAATPLAGLAPRTALLLRKHMEALRVSLLAPVSVAAVEAGGVRLADGRMVPAAFTVGAAGARPHDWLRDTGLPLTDGFVTVGPDLRSLADPLVFAVGDCAHLSHAPRPKAGVFAVREAPVLFDNLRAVLSGGRCRAYRPQKDYLKLISLGEKVAVADKAGLAVRGRFLWRLKDRIDRAFMDRFITLPDMPVPRLPKAVALGVRETWEGGRPPCAGCGAKVGGSALRRALDHLPAPVRADVGAGPGDDSAVLSVGGSHQVVTTDHLRAFTEDPWMLTRIAAVHAMGDVWAMGATPQAALSTVILPRMSAALQEETLREIMAAAADAFGEAGADLVGGHTSVGSELTVGFTVTGLSDGPPIRLVGAQDGDGLILTRPIGSGTILAADMARLAKGAWVAQALDRMARGQGAAAAVLRAHGARAMTDVTGFGLAGHLLTLLHASGVSARIDLAQVPFYHGAVDLAGAGVRSTLFPSNREAAAHMTVPDTPQADLLFDPQTAGGLLGAVPGDRVASCLDRLHGDGVSAARVIGTIGRGPVHIVVESGAG